MTSKTAEPATLHRGPLDWRVLVRWLREDGLIGPDDAATVTKRFGGGESRQHPLVRIGAHITARSFRS